MVVAHQFTYNQTVFEVLVERVEQTMIWSSKNRSFGLYLKCVWDVLGGSVEI